jgi:hypothetical protein
MRIGEASIPEAMIASLLTSILASLTSHHRGEKKPPPHRHQRVTLSGGSFQSIKETL